MANNTIHHPLPWQDNVTLPDKLLKRPLNNISVISSSSAADSSQATRPLRSITSWEVAYPSRRNTRFRHLSSSICNKLLAFFRSSSALFNSFFSCKQQETMKNYEVCVGKSSNLYEIQTFHYNKLKLVFS